MASDWQTTFDSLAHERYGALVGFARLVGAGEEAQDLVHEALISTFSRPRKFTSPSHAERYVKRAIASRLVDAERSKTSRKRRERVTAPLDYVAAPEHVLDTDLEAGLRALPVQQRACVVLRYLEGLSTAETASLLRLSEGSVKRYLHDGITTLQALIRIDIPDSAPHMTQVSTPRSKP